MSRQAQLYVLDEPIGGVDQHVIIFTYVRLSIIILQRLQRYHLYSFNC